MIQQLLRNANKYTHRHSAILMTGVSAVGVIATAYFSAVAGWRAKAHMEDQDPYMSTVDKTKLLWTFYIPPATAAAATIGAIAYTHHLGARRTAAAVSAYTITERAFSEYRKKVVEQIGSHKEQVIRDDIARDEVGNKNSSEVILAGSGDVMCCELYTRRYFMSSMENLRKAQNDINAKVIQELYVTLDEFYDLIGLPTTAHSGGVGWDSERLMELNFSTAMSEDGRPCLTFDYNYVKPI